MTDTIDVRGSCSAGRAGSPRNRGLVKALPLSSYRPGVVLVKHHSHTLPTMS